MKVLHSGESRVRSKNMKEKNLPNKIKFAFSLNIYFLVKKEENTLIITTFQGALRLHKRCTSYFVSVT